MRKIEARGGPTPQGLGFVRDLDAPALWSQPESLDTPKDFSHKRRPRFRTALTRATFVFPAYLKRL